jgi:uncharacterized membrane protein
MNRLDGAGFPIRAGILLGLGLGGFFDGIVLHQVLQWHHMLTDAGYPATSVENLKINAFWDGLFHATTYVFVVMGLTVLWRASRRRHVRWSTKLLAGTLLEPDPCHTNKPAGPNVLRQLQTSVRDRIADALSFASSS